MTVGELKRELSKYPEDLVVVLNSSGHGYESIRDLYEYLINYLDDKSTPEDIDAVVIE